MKIKTLSLILIFQLCFSLAITDKVFSEYPNGAEPPYEITHAYLYDNHPIVNGKLYVSVKTYDTDVYYAVSIEEADAGIAYQWYKNSVDSNSGGTPIENANSQYYIPKSEDVGSYLYCIVLGDDINYSGELTTRQTVFPVSETLELDGGLIICKVQAPSVNSELTGYLFSYGSIIFDWYYYPVKAPMDTALTGNEIASYQWYRNKNQSNIGGTAIAGATSHNYTPTKDDSGHYLYFTAECNGNYIGTITSKITDFPVAMIENIGGGTSAGGIGSPMPLKTPNGIAVKHATLTTDRIDWRRYFQWYRNDTPENFGGEPILGANLYKYTLTSEDVGKYVYVAVPSAVYWQTGEPIVSPVTEIVTDSEADITSISIELHGSDNPRRCYPIEINPTVPANLTATVQWYRNDTQTNSGGDPILGATYYSYTPTSYDVGKYLYCVYTPAHPFTGAPVASEVTNMVENSAVVIFDPNGGEFAFPNQAVEIGENCQYICMASALRNGYTHKGWATTKNAVAPDVDANTIITEDITFYAVWEKNPTNSSSGSSSSTTYNIKFVTNGGNTINSQNLVRNEKATKPTEPIKDGFIFDGWYTDAAFKYTYDFNTAISGNLTLYAKWTDTKEKISALLKNDADKIRYMKRSTDNTFEPDRAITRYEMLEALNNLLDLEKENSHNLTDVTPDYDELVALFTGAGIISGYDDNTFKGTDGLTRAEFVKIMSVILDIEIKETTENKFTDISTHWAKNYINSFADLGYLNGYNDGTFKPDEKLTRAEFITIINRIIDIESEVEENLFNDLESDHWAFSDIMKSYLK